jgi:ribosomal protein L1
MITWREKYMRDPELADSIINALRDDLKEAEKRAEMLTVALERIRDCDFVITLPDRMDAVRQIAREALE